MTAVVFLCIRACWKELSTKLGVGGGATTHRINSSQRLCSATSLGRESNRSSSATIHESRFSILFPMAIVSYRCVRERRIWSGEPSTNFGVSIEGGDGAQDDLERTKSFREHLCGISSGGDISEKRALPGSFNGYRASGVS